MTQQQACLSPSHAKIKRFRQQRCQRLPQSARLQLGRVITAMLIAIFLSVTLSGCNIGSALWDLIHTDGNAEAQIFSNENQRVRTFIITTDSFIIEIESPGDVSPNVLVQEHATVYTMTSNGTVRFESDGQNSLFDLQAGDQIIERPGADGTGLITIIDVADSST
jgi:hypothetical protein